MSTNQRSLLSRLTLATSTALCLAFGALGAQADEADEKQSLPKLRPCPEHGLTDNPILRIVYYSVRAEVESAKGLLAEQEQGWDRRQKLDARLNGIKKESEAVAAELRKADGVLRAGNRMILQHKCVTLDARMVAVRTARNEVCKRNTEVAQKLIEAKKLIQAKYAFYKSLCSLMHHK